MMEPPKEHVIKHHPPLERSAMCSPPLALLYKNRKKGKPSFNLDVDLDDDACDTLCKISKSSEELWKEISPPSPIASKATADWMSLDAAVQHASTAHSNIPRIEVDGPPDPSIYDPPRYNPANFNNHLSRVGSRGSSSNLTAGIVPLRSPTSTPASMLPPLSSNINIPPLNNTNEHQQPTLHATPTANTQLPVFSSTFANFAHPSSSSFSNTPSSSSNNSSSSMESYSNGHTPSITTNSISISGNVNINIQNTSAHNPSSSTSPTIQTTAVVPVPVGSQSPQKKDTRKGVPQFATPYSPQLKIHQYVPPSPQPEDGFGGNPNLRDVNQEKIRQRENERLWGEVMASCNKLKTHAGRGVVQPLSWSEINDSMNSTRHIMSSLVALLQLNSYAYANIYNSVGFHGASNDDMPAQFSRFQQFFDPFSQTGLQSLGAPTHMSIPNPDVHIKMENTNKNVDSYAHYNNTSPPVTPYGYDEPHQRKAARREPNISSSEGLQRSESAPSVSAGMSLSPIQNVMSLPNLSLSPVITALSNLTPLHHSGGLNSSTDSINNTGESSDDGGSGSSSLSRSYGSRSPAEGGAPAKGNWNSNKKSRGKKRTKYAEMDLMCYQCGVKQTPEWRRGPAGAKTLCNACGLHWAKVLKAEGKNGAGDSKKASFIEQKKNQFMMLAHKRHADLANIDSPGMKSETHH